MIGIWSLSSVIPLSLLFDARGKRERGARETSVSFDHLRIQGASQVTAVLQAQKVKKDFVKKSFLFFKFAKDSLLAWKSTPRKHQT
jgi:hypothetical protein